MADDILSIELDESRSLLHRMRKCHFLSAEFQINLDKGTPPPHETCPNKSRRSRNLFRWFCRLLFPIKPAFLSLQLLLLEQTQHIFPVLPQKVTI